MIFLNPFFILTSSCFGFVFSAKSGVVNPINLEDSKTFKYTQNKLGQVLIEITAFEQTFQLAMFEKDEIFFNEKLMDPDVTYITGKAFLNEVEIGAAFGEFRKVTQHFVGQFRNKNEIYYLEEENKKSLYIFRSSDQPQSSIKEIRSDNLKKKPERDPLDPIPSYRNLDEPTGFICPMKFTVDNVLYVAMDQDKKAIKSAVMRLVQALNAIYEENSIVVHRKHPYPVKFRLEELVIADSLTCSYSSTLMCSSSFPSDPDSFLKKHSYDNHENVCLSYLLTGHSFGQTLGVAYVGGVCASRGKFRDSRTRVSEERSINAGFIVIENPSTGLTQAEHTLAHEIGHNFGSSHDDGGCESGYLMAPYAPHEELSTTRKFSKCSMKQINSNLDDIRNGQTRNCFVEGKVPEVTKSVSKSKVSTTTTTKSTIRHTFNTLNDIFNFKGNDWTFNKWYSHSYRYHDYMSKEQTSTGQLGVTLTSTFVTILVLMVLGLVMFAYWKKKVCFAPKNPLHVKSSGPPRKSLRESLLFKRLRFIGRSQQNMSQKPPRSSMKIEPMTVKIMTNKFHKMEVEKNPPQSKSKLTPQLTSPQPKPVQVHHVEPKPNNLSTSTPRFAAPATPWQIPNSSPANVNILNPTNVNKFEAMQSPQQSPQYGFRSPVETEVIYSVPSPGLRPVHPAAAPNNMKSNNLVAKSQENMVLAMKKNFESNSDSNMSNRSQLWR